MSLGELQRKMKAALNELPAARSVIFYARDPVWADEFRLLHQEGVQHPEPTYGFLFPTSSLERVTNGESFEYMTNAQNNWRLNESLDDLPHALARDERLFGGFARREQVAASARLIRRLNGQPLAVMFVNFSEEVEESAFRQNAESLLDDLCGYLPVIRQKMEDETIEPSSQVVRIHKTIERLAKSQYGQICLQSTLEAFFRAFLETALQEFVKQKPSNSLIGTVHLLDPHTHRLNLVASVPSSISVPQSLIVEQGDGIISWVALKKRAILIADLDNSEYKRLYRVCGDGMKCEVAVPMIVGDDLIGVINLESCEAYHFGPATVRTLWYAATQAGIVCELWRQTTSRQYVTETLQKLLSTDRKAVDQTDGSALGQLAELMKTWAHADMCDIWVFRDHLDEFRQAGATSDYVDDSTSPRPTGWSNYVVTERAVVCLSGISREGGFQARQWAETDSVWIDPKPSAPQKLHDSISRLGIHAEVGLPIIVGNQPIGVAWLKYLNTAFPDPSAGFVSDILRFAANVGLVMDFIERYGESARAKQKALEDDMLEFRQKLFDANAVQTEDLELYVRHSPFAARIGGDFFRFDFLDEDKKLLAVVIGDGKGHAIPGALQMLPLFTAFNILATERTTATHYVLQKMGKVASVMGVQGTALYFIIDLSGKTRPPIISASSAAHPPIVILDKNGNNRDFPKDNVSSVGPEGLPILGIEAPPPLGEALTTCNFGDVIVAYTDGISEAGESRSGVGPFGRIGIVQTALSSLGKTSQEIADAIFESANKAGLHDDATVLVIKLHPKPRHRDR